jgi:serine/threonine protein kinase/tetratricopeptide (TPR) repeat protein
MATEESPANADNLETLATRTVGSRETNAALVIGHYHLLQRIGEGGMGEVWLAEQKEPVRRRVALKLVKAGMDTHEVVARFESERQALALMDHPAIAKVFDAGSTSQGAPYFVMEYVAGVPITTYCDNHRLSTRERLELFIRVCEGVQHAHQKAIIHRDLKPSNILVTEVDGNPAPKIIDFGVAKALTQKLTADTMFTRVGALVGTPEYMSPEQALSSGEDIDTRTDVYSLGIIFYELLAGVHPIDLRKVAFEEFLRRLREDDPPKLSTKFREQDPATSTELARKRQTEPPALLREMRGELDSIALKALEKDRSRRYGSPSEFALDIARYLNNEPVLAVPPSVAYRMRKLVRRHVLAFSFAATVLVLFIVFALAVTVQALRIASERDRANRVTQFMVGMFSVPNPSQARGNSVTAREILDKSANEVDASLRSEPEVQADLMRAMAESYNGLGLYPRARDLMKRVVEIERRALGPRNRKTLESMSFLGSILLSSGNDREASKWLQDALAVEEKALGPEDPDTLKTRRYLSDAFYGQSDFQNAERIARQTLQLQRGLLGAENPQTLATMTRLAGSLEGQGHYGEAESLDREVLEVRRRSLGNEDPATLQSINALGKVLVAEGKLRDAEVLIDEGIPAERRILGSEHQVTLDALGDLAYVYLKEGKYADAERLFREVVETLTHIAGSDNVAIAGNMEELAITYAREGRYADASRLFQQAIGIAEKNNSGIVKLGWYNFACAAAFTGHRDEAFRYLQEAIDHGFVYPDDISGDKDLASLHADPRFAAIIETARQRAAALQRK